MPQIPTYLQFAVTATDDLTFKITTLDIWFQEVDISIYTNPATMGNITEQNIALGANSVKTVKGPVRISDFVFKNSTAGQNTKVVIDGTALSDLQLRERGLL